LRGKKGRHVGEREREREYLSVSRLGSVFLGKLERKYIERDEWELGVGGKEII